MKRFITLSAVVVASVLFVMGTGIAQTGQAVVKFKVPGVVYTADEHGNSISAIDLASGNVKIVSVSISPHNVQVTADGALLLAVGEPVSDDHGHGAKEAKGRLLAFLADKVDPRGARTSRNHISSPKRLNTGTGFPLNARPSHSQT